MFRLRLWTTHLSIRETLNKPASAHNAANSGISAPLPWLDGSISLFFELQYKALSFGLIDEQDASIMKPHELWIFNKYLKNIQGEDTSCDISRFHNFSQRGADIWYQSHYSLQLRKILLYKMLMDV
jgi:hypothetical protein